MRIIVTAGPTREYIDVVRFITNASSGNMGCAVAAAATRAGHKVTLLAGPVCPTLLASATRAECEVVTFLTADDLKGALEGRFDDCDALVMAAAVGDFRPEKTHRGKIPRGGGPISVRLLPTEDILAGLRARKRPGQVIVAFAVEDGPTGQIERKARGEMADKGAEYVVVNTPAAMGARRSCACILSPAGVELPWADRPKRQLAREIIKLLQDHRART